MNKIIQDNMSKIKAVCKSHMVKSLYLFGSAATDNEFNEDSDIDLLVTYVSTTLDNYAKNYFTMADSLEEVFHRHVDLITTESLSNPYFIQELDKSKVLLYGE